MTNIPGIGIRVLIVTYKVSLLMQLLAYEFCELSKFEQLSIIL